MRSKSVRRVARQFIWRLMSVKRVGAEFISAREDNYSLGVDKGARVKGLRLAGGSPIGVGDDSGKARELTLLVILSSPTFVILSLTGNPGREMHWN